MKKFIAMVLCLAMVACLFVGCAKDDKTPDGGDDGFKVGVFYYQFSDVYLSSVRTALNAKLDAAGVQHQDFDGANTQATQNEQIQTAVTDGYNLLVVNLVTSGSSDAAKAIMEIAGDIPVIFFNRAVEGEDDEPGIVLNAYKNVCFVGTDAPEAGHLQGKMAGDYILANYDALDLNGDGVISYAMFKGDESNVEAIYRTQFGVEDANKVLTEAGKPAMVYFDANNKTGYQVDMGGAWSAAAALEYMNTNLAQYNESNKNMIEVILCNNDGMAEGVISALNTAGYNLGDGKSTTIPVWGVDATDSAKDLIANGKMTGTVKQDADGMAAAITEIVKAINAGTAITDAVATTSTSNEIFSVDKTLANKLYVAYAPYTGE